MPDDTRSDASSSGSPALLDEELRETLELVSTVLASVSNRVHEQTEVLNRVNRTASEARQAAFAAKAQTDPERYGELVAQTMAGSLDEKLDRVAEVAAELRQSANHARQVFAEAEEPRTANLRAIWEREQRLDRREERWRWFSVGVLVLGLVGAFALFRFVGGTEIGCPLVGGEWNPIGEFCSLRG